MKNNLLLRYLILLLYINKFAAFALKSSKMKKSLFAVIRVTNQCTAFAGTRTHRRRYTHTWLRQTTLMLAFVFTVQHVPPRVTIYKFEDRICKPEAQLSSPPGSTNINTKSYASAIGSGAIGFGASSVQFSPANNQDCTIQSEIAEVLEQDKRKKNIIIYNLTSSRTSDISRIEMLLEDITGYPPPAFYCRRIGKILAGKTRPVLDEFSSESDSRRVLHQAHYLKNMQSQWPRIVIAPDRTKQQQEAYRRLRLELQTRRSNGERLIISGNRIILDKRQHTPNPSAPTNPSLTSCFTSTSPLRVALPPSSSQDSCLSDSGSGSSN